MLRTILLVGTGGFIGSVMRYLVQVFVERGLSSTFPIGNINCQCCRKFYYRDSFCPCRKGKPDECRMAHLSCGWSLWRFHYIFFICLQ